MSIGVLPTRYGGVTFRSRLEARWAIVFDRLQIRWHYEHEGYEGAYGEYYLPDFWLPDVAAPVRSADWPPDVPVDGIHAEVKGSAAQLYRDMEKLEYAIEYHSTPVAAGLLILGPIPAPHQPAWHSFAFWHKGVVVHTVELAQGRVVLPAGDDPWVHCYAWTGSSSGLAAELLEPSPPREPRRAKLGHRAVRAAYANARNARFGT